SWIWEDVAADTVGIAVFRIAAGHRFVDLNRSARTRILVRQDHDLRDPTPVGRLGRIERERGNLGAHRLVHDVVRDDTPPGNEIGRVVAPRGGPAPALELLIVDPPLHTLAGRRPDVPVRLRVD